MRRALAVATGGLLALTADAARGSPVANPGFESFTSCPTQISQLALAPPWYSPTDASPDYFHTCGTGTAGVPANLWGSQAPFAGEAYAGIISYNSATLEREYLQQPLDAPLVSGASYALRFRVSLADDSGFAIDRMGAAFTTGAVTQAGFAPLPLTPQVENPVSSFLSDTTGWTLVSGSFVAAANHDHLTIGNFEDDSGTQAIAAGGSGIGAIYYVDGIELEAEACPGVVVDFESLEHVDALDASAPTPHSEDGIKVWGLASTDLRSFGTLHAWFNGSTAVHNDQVILTAADGTPAAPGSAFTLHWMDLSEYDPSQGQTSIGWTATKSDSSTVAQQVTLDGDGGLGVQRFHFPTFDDVVKVESFPFPAPLMQVDGVCVTPAAGSVPALGSWGAAVLALALLGAGARAQTWSRGMRRSQLWQWTRASPS